MPISDFVKELYPFVSTHGWKAGLVEYERSRVSKLFGHEYNVAGLMFSPSGSVWKLLLPEICQYDVLVADSSIGTIPLELCKTFKRVVVCSFYERGSSIISERAKEAAVSNVIVQERIDGKKLFEQGYRIGLSLIVVSQFLLEDLGKKNILRAIERFTAEIEQVAADEWTSVFLFPKKLCLGSPRNIYNKFGITSSVLETICSKHRLRIAYNYHLRHFPEKIIEINLGNISYSLGKVWCSRSLKTLHNDLKNLVKQKPIAYPSQLLAFSKKGRSSILLEGFIREVRESGIIEEGVSVRKYTAGNPNTILLELRTDSDRGYICRMPLGRGSSLPRAINNYKMLQELQSETKLSDMVPKPVDHGVFRGQPYFIETFLHGDRVKLSRSNHREVYDLIRPILFSFYTELGQEKVIDTKAFECLLGESLSIIRNHALDSKDLERISRLKTLLRERLLNATIRLPLVHGDFKIENMLFGSKELKGIFDWDLSMRFGFPFIDLFYLYSYSFHHNIGGNNYGIMDFITSQLLTGEYEPTLQMYYEDYGTSLGIPKEWKMLAGTLFWLHYVTKITGISFSIYDTHFYTYNVRNPLDIIIKRMM